MAGHPDSGSLGDEHDVVELTSHHLGVTEVWQQVASDRQELRAVVLHNVSTWWIRPCAPP